MPSNFKANNTDLDSIFLPLRTTKRANVGYSVAGTDISNLYEPGTRNVPTNFIFNGNDLSNLFRDISFRQLSFRYRRFGETDERYERNDDGQIQIEILAANLGSPLRPGTNDHYYTVRVGGTTQNRAFFGNSTTFTFTGLNSQSYSVSVIDSQGLSTSLSISVPYGGGWTGYTTSTITN